MCRRHARRASARDGASHNSVRIAELDALQDAPEGRAPGMALVTPTEGRGDPLMIQRRRTLFLSQRDRVLKYVRLCRMNPFFVQWPHKSKVGDATTEPLGVKAGVAFYIHHGVAQGRVATEKNSLPGGREFEHSTLIPFYGMRIRSAKGDYGHRQEDGVVQAAQPIHGDWA